MIAGDIQLLAVMFAVNLQLANYFSKGGRHWFLGVTVSHVILSCSQYSYNITRRKQLCHAYWLARVRDPTTPLLSKVNRGAEFLKNIILKIWFCFHLWTLHNKYHMPSQAITIPEYLLLGDTKVHYRAFGSPRGKYSGMSPSKPCDIFIMLTGWHYFLKWSL